MCFASSHNQEKDNDQLKKKTKNNCQKIELYGSPTTKELKKKHSTRLAGGAEMGSQGREDMRQDGSWQAWMMRQWLADQAVSHLLVDKLGGTTGEQDRPCNPGFQCSENKA